MAEEINLKIYATYELNHFQVPMKGIPFTDVSLVEHYKQIRAQWCAIEVRDNRIEIEERMGENDYLDILDEIGIMNLENAMED